MREWKRRRRTGGGVLLDLASHHIDLLRWLLDIEVAEVEASLGSELSEGDTARLRLRTSSGVLAEGFFSFRDTRTDWLEFVGDLGRLRVDRYGWAIELRREIGRSSTRTRLPPVWEPTSWRMRKLLRPQHDPSWRSALTAFIGRILGNSCELPGPIDGLRSLEVVLAAEQSARLSAPVTPAAVSAS
jgi:predicted dehydrogenase